MLSKFNENRKKILRALGYQNSDAFNTYNDESGDLCASSGTDEYVTEFIYENGRLMATSYSGYGYQTSTTYSYNGDTVTETITNSHGTSSCQFQIDKYGNEIEGTQVDL